jgi:hypothetical protein
MCENLLECFNSCVPQNIDKLVKFFYMLSKLFTVSTILWHHSVNFMPHCGLLTVVFWQRKATDLRCEYFEIFSE